MNALRQPDPTDAIGPMEELRSVADTLRRLDHAAASTQWSDDSAMTGAAVAEAVLAVEHAR